MTTPLSDLLATALAARGPLIEGLLAEQTDAYRLFHGTTEGLPGLAAHRFDIVFLDPLREVEWIAPEGDFPQRGRQAAAEGRAAARPRPQPAGRQELPWHGYR